MAEEILIQGSGFAKRGSVGFGIAYIKDEDGHPLVGLVAVDLETRDEAWHRVHRGETVEVADQTWQLTEIRHPPGIVKGEIVLRRVA